MGKKSRIASRKSIVALDLSYHDIIRHERLFNLHQRHLELPEQRARKASC